MRALEYQYKRSMEEEQEEFGQDLLNLQADVGEITWDEIDYTSVSI